jgi:aspartate-semialdehyde dehydrogenase
MMQHYSRIAVVGATGAVGNEALAILAAAGVPAARIRALASQKSAGTHLPYAGGTIPVHALDDRSFAGTDLALFCATSDVARQFVPLAVEAGAIVVDNSSAFRHDPAVPLVIPEVNGELVTSSQSRTFANPNCSTIILLVAVAPIARAFGVQRIVVSTYQAVSGAGARALEELTAQAADVLAGKPAAPGVFSEPCAFNVFSHNSAIDPATGLNGEELKIIRESHRILADDRVSISPTCVRVPVLRAHSEAITLTLDRPASEQELRDCLAAAPGVRIVDDRRGNRFPTPLKATHTDDVLVGRIRLDPGTPADVSCRSRGVCLFVCADQLRKGAALNAIQIAEIAAAGRPALARG